MEKKFNEKELEELKELKLSKKEMLMMLKLVRLEHDNLSRFKSYGIENADKYNFDLVLLETKLVNSFNS